MEIRAPAETPTEVIAAVVIKNQYFSAADFDHDLAFVMTDDGIAYIDTKGAVVWKSAPRPKLQLK